MSLIHSETKATSISVTLTEETKWSLQRRIIFRFFFVYLFLQIAPWMWLSDIPNSGYILTYHFQLMNWAVNIANEKLFHVTPVLVYPAGSGDTSYGWAQQWLFLLIAIAGCLIWSILDRKHKSYRQLNYWLCVFTRYNIALIAFSYGFIKLFALQMPFPNQSQLATPLGDFLPMRLSWLFIGYSTPYQFFGGLLETIAGALLLFRRTATLGVLIATAVFTNVMMLNLSYDIPVKIFSINIVVMCLFLLASEYKRILCFFVLNKPASLCSLYHFPYSKKWMRVTRIIFKIGFVIIAVVLSFSGCWERYKSVVNTPEIKPIKSGIYDVALFVLNKDTIAPVITNTSRWQDVIFEKGSAGSIKTSDTIFRQRYSRGYFSYSTDTIKHIINFKKLPTDSAMYNGIILFMNYQLPDSNTIQLWGKQRNDSLYVLLKRSDRHFQLAEKQFHWLSEYNR